MPRLLMIAPAPVIETTTGFQLDVKFAEGMRLHSDLWSGQVDCLLRRGAATIAYPTQVTPSEIPYGLRVLDADQVISADMLRGYDIVFAAADAHGSLHIAALGAKIGVRVVFTIEYILQTRLQIAWLNPDKPLLRRAYSMGWNLWHEHRRRHAFRQAYGLQANGYPAFNRYRRLNGNTMLYLDNRMKPALFATETEMQNRARRLLSKAPLRLVYSGRLEPMKGAQDLIPVASRLREQGVGFRLDIFGDGSLRETMATAIATQGLGDLVALHEPVDFETRLVPFNRTRADIFLCCHRQSDPSCTYLESMGCGLPIIGYDNRMWSALQKQSGAGWVVARRNAQAIAAQVDALCADRQQLVDHGQRSLEFAQAHGFDQEFARRMEHLNAAVAG